MGRGIGVGAAVGCMAAVLAGPGLAAKPPAPPPDPTALWRAYPLQPPPPAKATAAKPPAATLTPPVPAPPAPRAHDDGGNEWLAFALGGALALVVLVASVVLVARRTRRPFPPATPGAIPFRRPAPDELIALANALAKEVGECNTFVHCQHEGGTGDMTETTEQEAPGTGAAEPETVAAKYADIGARVAGVLSAAEDAAQQIRVEARSEADGLLAAARADADGVRSEADAYDAEIRTAVETFASERRREADAEIQRLLSDSEAQARATRQAAEEMARQIEEDGIRRGQALRAESQVVEDRLKKALVSFRRITAELEELVGTAAPTETTGSLADALRPYGRGEERKPLAAVPSDEGS